jgi:two-component system NarL family response regulator
MNLMTAKKVIGVFVVDDHPVLRAGLVSLIDGEPDMHVVGQAANGDEAMEKFAALQPDITLMDLRLPNMSGIQLTTQLRTRWPEARIIMFTSHTKEEEIYEALKSGVWSYIRKNAAAPELLEAIRSVHAGVRHIPPDIGRCVVDHMAQDDLSPRERQVLQQMAQGLTNREIAVALDISEHTVNVHVRNLMSKLQVTRRTEAIATAVRKGLLQID